MDFFETKYEIKGGMGVIVYRYGKYLTSVRDIQQDEDVKFNDFNNLLEGFKDWEVRPSPKEFRLAKKKADKEKAAKAEAAKKVEPVEQGAECCVIL
ncbi:hypothetical protein GGI22_000600 [Coemansia erecta]|nr:hypothetical protein GGI22_000600 [Coemansia erecta]